MLLRHHAAAERGVLGACELRKDARATLALWAVEREHCCSPNSNGGRAAGARAQRLAGGGGVPRTPNP